MTVEKWAIPIFTAAGFKKASVTATKRSDICCACCKICSEWKGLESPAEPFEGMHVYVCNHTYHWSCLLRLGCCKDRDQVSVEKDETWACPDCACLTNSEKESWHHFAENEELKVVAWDATWEPEEMTIHADFEQEVQEYLMNKDPGLDFSAPPADISLDNLERQGFSKEDTFDPWHQKSDYILRNKVIFDVTPD